MKCPSVASVGSWVGDLSQEEHLARGYVFDPEEEGTVHGEGHGCGGGCHADDDRGSGGGLGSVLVSGDKCLVECLGYIQIAGRGDTCEVGLVVGSRLGRHKGCSHSEGLQRRLQLDL